MQTFRAVSSNSDNKYSTSQNLVCSILDRQCMRRLHYRMFYFEPSDRPSRQYLWRHISNRGCRKERKMDIDDAKVGLVQLCKKVDLDTACAIRGISKAMEELPLQAIKNNQSMGESELTTTYYHTRRGQATWPQESFVDEEFKAVVHEMCEPIALLITEEATLANMSANTGNFFPCVYHIAGLIDFTYFSTQNNCKEWYVCVY